MGLLQLRACVVDLDQLQILRGGGEQSLTVTEARLLRYLAARAGQVVAQDQLLAEVWAYSPRVVSRTVTTTIARLRAKIEVDAAAPDHLITHTGEGYALVLTRGHRAPAGLFVGRGELLDSLHRPEARIVTLTGPPGVGKTRIAEEHVSSLLRMGRPAVLVDLSGASSTTQMLEAVAAALGVTLGPEPTEQLGHVLAQEGALVLVLDNLEQLAPHVGGPLERWLAQAPAVWILGTSQVPLGVDAEHVVPVPVLDTATAIELLAARGRAVRPAFAIAPGAVDTARAVVEGLDRLPLAIELAAGWLDVLDLEGLRDRLGERLDLDGVDRPERHGSLRAALDHSFALLDEADREVLVDVSVFEGPFDAATADAVVRGAALRALRTLGTRGWLRQDDARFQLLPTTRAYLRERLSPGVRARHLAHHRALAVGGRLTAVHLPDARAAARHAVAHDPAAAAAIALGLEPVLASRSNLVRLEVLEPLVHHLEALEPEVRVWVRIALASTLGPAGRLDEAADHCERAIAQAAQAGLARWHAIALVVRAEGITHRGGAHVGGSVQEALDAAERVGGAPLRDALLCRGRWLIRQGQLDAALGVLHRARALAERHDDRRRLVSALREAAVAHQFAHRPEEALGHVDHALSLEDRPTWRPRLWSQRARALLHLGRTREAAEVLARAAREQGRLGLRLDQVGSLTSLGEVAYRHGRFAEALAHLTRAAALADANPRLQGGVSLALAMVHLASGHAGAATEHARFAVSQNRELPRPRALCMLALAQARHLAGDLDEAVAVYTSALDLFEQLGLADDAVQAAAWLAAARTEAGLHAQAPASTDPIVDPGERDAAALCAWLATDPSRARDVARALGSDPAPEVRVALAIAARMLGP